MNLSSGRSWVRPMIVVAVAYAVIGILFGFVASGSLTRLLEWLPFYPVSSD